MLFSCPSDWTNSRLGFRQTWENTEYDDAASSSQYPSVDTSIINSFLFYFSHNYFSTPYINIQLPFQHESTFGALCKLQSSILVHLFFVFTRIRHTFTQSIPPSPPDDPSNTAIAHILIFLRCHRLGPLRASRGAPFPPRRERCQRRTAGAPAEPPEAPEAEAAPGRTAPWDTPWTPGATMGLGTNAMMGLAAEIKTDGIWSWDPAN